jgi:hypothetical protein
LDQGRLSAGIILQGQKMKNNPIHSSKPSPSPAGPFLKETLFGLAIMADWVYFISAQLLIRRD